MITFLRDEALISYLILAILALILSSPFYQLKITKLLANLTQSLIIEEINPVRTSYGFLELKPNEKLIKAAQLKAEDMLAKDYFSHQGPEGEAPWVWLERVGYQYAAAGENLAIDFDNPAVLKNAWLASSSHAKNILNSYFTDIGIGIARGELNGGETTVVVMFLGREIRPDLKLSPSAEIVEKAEKKDVPAQEPLVTKTVEEIPEEVIEKEVIGVAETESPKPEIINFQIFLLNKFPKLFRILLTIFYGLLIIWLIISLIFRKQKTSFILSRTAILLFLSLLPWLPIFFKS